MKYVLFIKEECPFCIKAKELLIEKNENFKLVTFNHSQEEVLKEIKEAYDWPTVPMIFHVTDSATMKFVGGYTDLERHLNEQ
jgi:glutaredoxin